MAKIFPQFSAKNGVKRRSPDVAIDAKLVVVNPAQLGATNWLREMIGHVDMKSIWPAPPHQPIATLSAAPNCSVDTGVLENVASVEWEECTSDVHPTVVEYWCVHMIVRRTVLTHVHHVPRSVIIAASTVTAIRNVESRAFRAKTNARGSAVITNVPNCAVSCAIGRGVTSLATKV